MWLPTGEALASVAAARGAAYTAWRTYYAAHAALAAGDERLAEAAGLFGRAQQRAAAAVEGIQVREGGGGGEKRGGSARARQQRQQRWERIQVQPAVWVV